MTSPHTTTCPGCGKTVVIPSDDGYAGAYLGRRLDQVAQALCGCWVGRLPDDSLSRLVGAIMAWGEIYDDPQLSFFGGKQ